MADKEDKPEPEVAESQWSEEIATQKRLEAELDQNDVARDLDPPGFDEDDRQGLFILTVGRPGSGKSTFQHRLLHYIDSARHLHLEAFNVDDRSAAQELLSVYRKQWARGMFPARTKGREPREFSFGVRPVNRYKHMPPFRFRFVEAAGEAFMTAEVSLANRRQSLDTYWLDLIKSESVRLIIVLVVDGRRPEADDNFFQNFFEYLRGVLGPQDFLEFQRRHRVVLLLSKPKDADSILGGQYTRTKLRPAERIDAFFSQYVPNTYSMRGAWPGGFGLAQLNVGVYEETDVDDESEGDRTRVIKRPNFSDTEKIFNWIYLRATGRKMRDTFIKIAKRWLRDNVA